MKFEKFEKINKISENHTVEEIKNDSSLLEAYGLTEADMPEIEKVNEGLFDKFKNMLSKALPGGALNKAEKILAQYEKMKKDTLKKVGKLRLTAFQAKTKAKNDNKFQDAADEMTERTKKSIRVLEDAENKKLSAIEDQLNAFLKDKPERVKTYVTMRVAEIQEKMADLEMKDAEEYASEEELKKLENIIKKKGKIKELAAKKLEKSAKDKKADTKAEDKAIDLAKKDAAKAEAADGKEKKDEEKKPVNIAK